MSLFSNRRVDDRKQIFTRWLISAVSTSCCLTASCNRSVANLQHGERDTRKAMLRRQQLPVTH